MFPADISNFFSTTLSAAKNNPGITLAWLALLSCCAFWIKHRIAFHVNKRKEIASLRARHGNLPPPAT
jgi:hypothetical protein